MRLLRKLLLIFLLLFCVFIALFLIIVGPWPTYGSSRVADQAYYQEAMIAIEQTAALSEITEAPGRLQAGWASRSITPDALPPLAGYGARPGDKRATGVRDPVEVRVLALSDGVDTIALVGADLLIIPPNVAELVRARAASESGLAASNILLNASHTHCGPGGFAPGWLSKMVAGPYEGQMPEFLANAMADAINEAYRNLAPASAGAGSVDAPQFIRNRVREGAPVDSELSYLVVEQEDGDRCYLVSYSAHPTIFGAGMTELSAEYPGELLRHLHAQPDSPAAVYLGGAVGSMSPVAPEAADPSARVQAMGQALAELVMANAGSVTLEEHLDIASVGIPVGLPSLQVRPLENNTSWRLSPILARLLGLPTEGWMHGARLGDILFMGMPCDFGGEISVKWKEWAGQRQYDLWTLSFNGAYCGYFSPDEHYLSTPLNYETGPMSWFGPDTEAYFTALFQEMTERLTGVEAPALEMVQ